MTTEQFAYWLQGYSEICGKTPTKEQWVIIQDHLGEVFNKVTPNRKEPTYCFPLGTPGSIITTSFPLDCKEIAKDRNRFVCASQVVDLTKKDQMISC